jgi:hypothetical protein
MRLFSRLRRGAKGVGGVSGPGAKKGARERKQD